MKGMEEGWDRDRGNGRQVGQRLAGDPLRFLVPSAKCPYSDLCLCPHGTTLPSRASASST